MSSHCGFYHNCNTSEKYMILIWCSHSVFISFFWGGFFSEGVNSSVWYIKKEKSKIAFWNNHQPQQYEWVLAITYLKSIHSAASWWDLVTLYALTRRTKIVHNEIICSPSCPCVAISVWFVTGLFHNHTYLYTVSLLSLEDQAISINIKKNAFIKYDPKICLIP